MNQPSLPRAALFLVLTSPLLACGSTPGAADAFRPDATLELDTGTSLDTGATLDTGAELRDTGAAPEDTAPQRDGGTTGCGGRGSPPCAPGTFCDFPPSSMCGRADGPGVCAPVPDVCTREFRPVCGCDGVTYANPCLAARASVSVESDGPCPIACDPDRVACDAAPPRCEGGTVPSVAGGCWTGECVTIDMCTCATFDDCPMVPGLSELCYPSGRCGPLL
ncbi:MAG: Kazal-type serine protease inhibitor domain-containing protein [Deltaproteobacteria bacterium]